MNEDAQLVIDVAREKMEKVLLHLETELSRVRAGKANPHLLDGIHVDFYGANTPLSQVSNISTPDPKTIAIQPWDKSMISVIEKAILASSLGITPANNGEVIRINIPPLTEERRRDLTRQVKHEGETAKVGIRNSRREANDELKKFLKEGLPEDDEKKAVLDIQKLTDDFIVKVDKVVEMKDKEIMTV